MVNFIKLADLEVYKLSRNLSSLAWKIYDNLGWQDKKIMGDQFLTSTDSFGASIAEGYSLYHYLDRIKFFYNARGSLAEASNHWLELLVEREKIKKADYEQYKEIAKKSGIKLNNLITSLYKAKKNYSA